MFLQLNIRVVNLQICILRCFYNVFTTFLVVKTVRKKIPTHRKFVVNFTTEVATKFHCEYSRRGEIYARGGGGGGSSGAEI